jgi:hypothetical protein
MNPPVKKTGLEALREPFEPHLISKRPQPIKKDAPKGRCPECGGWHGLPAIHLDYVGHAALTSRLLDIDPNWNWEPVATDANGLPLFDTSGGLWIRLTVCGFTRLGYGDAEGKKGPDAVKEAIGDALRNAAMRFGAALDLWHKGELRPPQLSEEQMIQTRASFRAAKSLAELATIAGGAGEFADEEQRLELRKLYTECKKALKERGDVDESGERGAVDGPAAYSEGEIQHVEQGNQHAAKDPSAGNPGANRPGPRRAGSTERRDDPGTSSGDGLP